MNLVQQYMVRLPYIAGHRTPHAKMEFLDGVRLAYVLVALVSTLASRLFYHTDFKYAVPAVMTILCPCRNSHPKRQCAAVMTIRWFKMAPPQIHSESQFALINTEWG